MNRKTMLIGGAVGLVALVGLGFFLTRGSSGSVASASTTVRAQDATVTRGTLVATVNAAGNISAPKSASLAFQSAGRVAKVNVAVGDSVKTGQVLLELDLTDLNLSLKNSQASLSSSQANFDSAKSKNAQNPNQLIVAKSQLDKAAITLQKAQGDYNAIAWRGDVGMTSQAAALQTATIDYQSALANFNQTAATINDTALRQAQASLDQAQVSVDQAVRNIEKAKIIAPFDGIVSAVNLNVNDTAGTNAAAAAIVDLSSLQVRVTLSEVDIAKIKTGQTAQMTVDALSGKTYNAQVQTVSPVGTVTQGVVNYPVTLVVNNVDGAIKPGMTANLAIVVERRENVLIIPNRAVRTQGNSKTVTVLFKGEQISVPIGTGLSNDSFVEVTNGLNEGDTVIIQTTQTRTGNVPGVGGQGAQFFAPGR
ncbi:MAG: efflux RND transporter periplasmic adaptor subunit [Chloroflexi bacterium]|nr:efflux RND transporter periplasmic adaptor subunit [Chloroflexota bacterium]